MKDFYKDKMDILLQTKAQLTDYIQREEVDDIKFEHYKIRIKQPSSVIKKLKKKGYSENLDQAFAQLKDIVGIRIVCPFLSDVYNLADSVNKNFHVVNIKDFIKNPKPNGYRSYHMIIEINGIFAEFQIRTISQDSWASLEHQMMYKKDGEKRDLIIEELKKCADDLASTDLNMDTIRDLINS